MKYRIFSILIVLAICVQALVPCAAATVSYTQTATQQDISDAILSLQEEYPDGMTWTNNSPNPAYVWRFKGSVVSMGGCAAFAAILQDRVFGSIVDVPVTWQRITEDCAMGGVHECSVPYSWENLWPGDIIDYPGHIVIVLEKYDDHITIAEGNNCGQIRWGRTITKEGVATANYVLTRYNKTEPLMPFVDLPDCSHWSYESVTWAILCNVAAPISDTTFAPNAGSTRADMITFLWNASGCPAPMLTDLPFHDIPVSASYRTAVLWAIEHGITSGTSATTFSPDALCTRAQALTFLWRAEGSPKDGNDIIAFEDVAISEYYFSTVAWATVNHITSGTSATTFSPERVISRAEALTFLYIINGPQA